MSDLAVAVAAVDARNSLDAWNLAQEAAAGRWICLHVGCGPNFPEKLHKFFRGPRWFELRYDIEPAVRPDIVGSMTDLSGIPNASVDGIWSSHNIEHLFAHEVPMALKEFYRVLKPGAPLLVTLPDLQGVCQIVADGRWDEVLGRSVNGQFLIKPLDVIYGWGAKIAGGEVFMAHKTGFTSASLGKALGEAGFGHVHVVRKPPIDLWAMTFKDAPIPSPELLQSLIL